MLGKVGRVGSFEVAEWRLVINFVSQSVEFTSITSAKQFPLEQLKRGMTNFPFTLSQIIY